MNLGEGGGGKKAEVA